MIYENQTDYWNHAANGKKFTTFLEPELINPIVSQESRIVDYGCGYGRTMNELHGLGYRNIVGYDFSPEMITRGKAEYPHLNLNLSYNNNLPLESGSVDLVLLFAVLTCIITNEEQESLMTELSRVIKPGGSIYINDFLLNTDDRNLARYEKFSSKYGVYGAFELDEGAVLRHNNDDRIRELTFGFETQIYKNVVFDTMNGHTSNGFVFIGRKKLR